LAALVASVRGYLAGQRIREGNLTDEAIMRTEIPEDTTLPLA
jgi:hypothetical protein